jgi:hypothetical protein
VVGLALSNLHGFIDEVDLAPPEQSHFVMTHPGIHREANDCKQ